MLTLKNLLKDFIVEIWKKNNFDQGKLIVKN